MLHNLNVSNFKIIVGIWKVTLDMIPFCLEERTPEFSPSSIGGMTSTVYPNKVDDPVPEPIPVAYSSEL